MATEKLWVSLEGCSRTNSPCQRFHSQLCCKIVWYFCWTLYYFLQKCCSTENGVYTFERKWHILVNVTIIWGYTRRHAHTFHMQISTRWQPHSEMWVHKKMEEQLYVNMAVLHSNNAQEVMSHCPHTQIAFCWSCKQHIQGWAGLPYGVNHWHNFSRKVSWSGEALGMVLHHMWIFHAQVIMTPYLKRCKWPCVNSWL